MARFWISNLPPTDLPLADRCAFVVSLAYIKRNISPTAAEVAEILGVPEADVIAALSGTIELPIEGDERGYRVNMAKFAAKAKGEGMF